ncbi:MAG: ABC transporter ATP-binding protein [Bacillota bacterium]|nr:ABC transporter ATP-binding protein [Bacillota bacterium]
MERGLLLPGSPLLEVNNLRVEFTTDRSKILAVDGVDISLERGKTLGLVGESGCGKSVTALAVMGLLPRHASISGEVIFKDRNLLKLRRGEIVKIRGNQISMIFQEPMTSLNPVFNIEYQLAEVFKLHRGKGGKEVRSEIVDLLRTVGIPNPERRMKDYPHQLSGGMRQRVMIAMAMACEPDILIADEPTTALDVTIQAQILELMKELQRIHDTGLLMITHDLGVIAQVAENVAVMYAGHIMEYSGVRDIFSDPLHPYTRGLLNTIPRISKKRTRLEEIKGTVPHMSNVPPGCRFHERCSERLARCSEETPPLSNVNGRTVRCWLYK